MIINHKYKFIFLKTRKTASTSLEIALSQFCDTNDIITPITPEDEKLRKRLGFTGPINYMMPIRYYEKSDWKRLLLKGKLKHYYNHVSASFIKNNISNSIWNNYFKFCFERNPYDKAISRYYWDTHSMHNKPNISDYLKSVPNHLLSNWNIYTINDKIAIDFVGRYENLKDDLLFIVQKISFPKKIDLPNAKGQYRQNKRHFNDILSAQDYAQIERICHKEILEFSYKINNK